MATVTIVTWGFLFLSIVPVVFTQMFPGTKWCGPGHIAKDDSDFGELVMEDTCCRDHDHCPRNIHAGENKWGVTNTGNFTWSDCECDYALKDCLKKANSSSADILGGIYYKLNAQCLRFNDNGTAHFEDKPTYDSTVSALIDLIIGALG